MVWPGRDSESSKRVRLATLITGIAFVIFSLAVTTRLLAGFDYWALSAAQVYLSPTLDQIGWFFSVIGGIEFTVLALLGILIVVWLQGRRTLAVRAVVAMAGMGVVEVICKFFLPYMRVPDETSRSTGEGGFFSVLVPYLYPYPSGHLLRTVFVLGLLMFLIGRNRVLEACVAVVLIGMGWTRVYMSVHWATDVIGGMLLGLVGLLWTISSNTLPWMPRPLKRWIH